MGVWRSQGEPRGVKEIQEELRGVKGRQGSQGESQGVKQSQEESKGVKRSG